MTDLFSDLKKQYKHNVAAEALFFKADPDRISRPHALRLEVSEIGREFTDGTNIGKDPEGTFYYNKIRDLKLNTKDTTYLVARVVNPSDSKPCSSIKFYNRGENSSYAEFLAYDKEETVTACGMDGYKYFGKWQELEQGSATAVVTKDANSDDIYLAATSIQTQAKISDNYQWLKDETVDVHGILYFKDKSQIRRGGKASYSNDRIVFYEYNSKGAAEDFTAYFIPYESSTGKLGLTAAQSNDKEFEDITWMDIK
ncbi:uncharacterized protein PHACADRAFT_211333 [Phanerochaete carnosa HHB-10118-sp]|uniref:Uncharacterized protein n=1 Tax=Phanerochaete carnosa (strain HHB-10118-sp) TaxID=650164 RepID=K5UUH4_PHACS|nr:uncharacterized protein PHACADRAFT_211333 [Phanerochaete carnosa HHB-10118-sp]EKM53661.1 hypothetical protein PHACADRAFT_211333 [Phanerochaete carnosa HHB-10118-sp]